jgi:hypothetical protein
MAHGTIARTAAAPRIAVTRFRAAPGAGELPVRSGDAVDAADVVATIMKPGAIHAIDVAAQLGISRGRIAESLAVRAGDAVVAGQVIAQSRALFGLWTARASSPVDGVVDTVSPVTGQVVVRERATAVVVRAFASGRVTDVQPGVGVEIRAEVSLVQGILGLGGEAMGALVRVGSGAGALEAADLGEAHAGAAVFTEGRISLDAMRRAREIGVAALVGASAYGEDLVALLGASPNLAAAGDEALGFALLITEGLGELRMAPRTRELLAKLDGARVSVNGVTQVRAGVIRPDLLGPPIDGAPLSQDSSEPALGVGSRVRIVRGRRTGVTGDIAAVLGAPALLGSGASALVFDVRLDDGDVVRVPRQNVEGEG